MSLLLDLIFPRTCYSCHHPGRYLCLNCQSKLIVRSIKYHKSGNIEGHLPLFHYHQPLKPMIQDLKFKFVSDLIPEISLLISRTLKTNFPHLLEYWQKEKFILVPIPLHPHRQNWRGFNQSELIVHELSPLINLNYQHLLIRHIDTPPQTSIKDKSARHTNISSAFHLDNQSFSQSHWENQNIILFDDVYTTGSTIRSAATIFPKSSKIWALTIAG